MKNESNRDPENPAELSAQDLLRFLEAVPQILRDRERDGWSAENRAQGCPDAGLFLRSVLGELDAADREALEAHAALCPECERRLAESRKVVQGNPSAEETAAIAELAASRTEGQRRLALELARTPRRKRGLARLGGAGNGFAQARWLAAGAGLAAALLLALGVSLWLRLGHSPERELAKAYQESRTMELRVPDAGYAALSLGAHSRGAGGGAESPALLEARAELARALERSPRDRRWLELGARADVLEERYDSAIDVLDRLLAGGPVTAELLTDAANAHYQRGLVTGSEADRTTALDDLARADKLAPADPVVLFNEAIVMEDRGQLIDAVEVWNRYITVERDAQWREEGKRKLTALEQALNRQKSGRSQIRRMPATPAAILALARDARG